MPALVAELVARGGAVHAVVPARHTLEERFLSLLGAAAGRDAGRAPDRGAGDTAAGPAALAARTRP